MAGKIFLSILIISEIKFSFDVGMKCAPFFGGNVNERLDLANVLETRSLFSIWMDGSELVFELLLWIGSSTMYADTGIFHLACYAFND